MSFQERRAIVSVVSTILITALYSAYMAQSYPAGNQYSAEVFRYWGLFFLVLIPVSIVAKIIVSIIFSIINMVATKEKEPLAMDERDKSIELKATRNSLYVFTLGFMLAMGSLVLDMPPSTMFIILISAGVASDLVSDLSQFYFYRRGF